jgi:hypothetical protein
MSNICNNGLRQFKCLQKLELYDIYSTISDRGLKVLTTLETLVLRGCKTISDSSIQKLINLRSLTIINRGSMVGNITDNSVSRLHNLEDLSLYNISTITDRSIARLNLIKLTIRFTSNITDVGLQKLTRLRTLTLIETGHRITDAGIMCLHNLVELNINSNHITDLGIQGLSYLQRLVIHNNRYITNNSIQKLSSLLLRKLIIIGNTRVTGDAVKHIKSSKFIEYVE